jgi:ribosomal protein S18 acetylase RimI-like enzyme
MRSVLESVEILDLRHYSSGSLRPLLNHECELWAKSMAWDYQSSAEMILRYIDSKILPGYVAVENGRVVGYTFFVYESSKGVIGDLFVSAEDSKQEAEIRLRLLTHAIETLQQTPGIHRAEAQLLVHDTGVLSQPFIKQGFTSFPRLFMRLPLKPMGPRSRMTQVEGIEIRHWAESDFHNAATLITACYLGHIDSDINDQYRTSAGSLRFLNNIVRFPGCGIFDAQGSFVARSRSNGAMIGLLLCSRVRADVGHVTQVCVLPEYRGRRLGEALMETCTANLRSRNFTELSLTVTRANTRAVELYERLGFETKRVFDAFVWES